MSWLVMLSGLGVALAQEATEAPAEAAPTAEAPPAPAGPTRYALAPAESFLAVVVYKDPGTIGSAAAHDHAVVASTFSGAVSWDGANVGSCSVEITVPVADLVVDPGNARQRVGIDPADSVGEGAKAQIKENFSGKTQLDAASFPNITFKSSSCVAEGAKVKVNGTMTLRGKTKAVSVLMDISATPDKFTGSGSFTVKHTDFGFQPFSALLGAVKNQDPLRFVIDVVGRPG